VGRKSFPSIKNITCLFLEPKEVGGGKGREKGTGIVSSLAGKKERQRQTDRERLDACLMCTYITKCE
jgi:hypothetical protein